MSKQSYLFIVNPVAGKNKGNKLIPMIKAFCLEQKIQFKIIKTEKYGGATAVINRYIKENYDVYIAVGGDGTVNEVANGMVGSDKVLAIIPCGTGNDFAKTLGLPRDPMEALKLIFNGTPQLIDIGSVNNQCFINIASIGLDAEIADYTNKIKRWFKGAYAYVIALIKVLINFKPMLIKFNEEGKSYSKKIMLVAICNGRYYGGGMKIAPHALLTDGCFDVCVIEKMSRLKLLFLFPSVFKGKHSRIKHVKIHRTRAITIEGEGPLKINLDGEIIKLKSIKGGHKASFEIVNTKLKVMK